ncbi:MAG TPA: XdhC family protein, partial [Vicinamibacterales bacterium]|nr:XdhC family protein [Vicinamibacterales bacterium]
MSTLYRQIAALHRDGRPFALATVVRTQGSTPQVVGAKLVVTADDPRGRAAGTLGGGCVEADAILAARETLSQGGRSLRAYELTEDLAWNTGLVCGGTMWILAERGEDALNGSGRSMIDALADAAGGGPPIAIVTHLARSGRSSSFVSRAFVSADGGLAGSLGDASLDAMAASAAVTQMRHGTPRLVSLDEEHDLLIEPVTGRPGLAIAGGGHV